MPIQQHPLHPQLPPPYDPHYDACDPFPHSLRPKKNIIITIMNMKNVVGARKKSPVGNNSNNNPNNNSSNSSNNSNNKMTPGLEGPGLVGLVVVVVRVPKSPRKLPFRSQKKSSSQLSALIHPD